MSPNPRKRTAASPGLGAVAAILDRLGLPTSLLSPLLAHAEAVRRASSRLGLVSTGDEAVILRRHTADSLVFALARAPGQGERWVDVGAGAGFPGLVLAVCYPHAEFTVVEAQAKKAGFLDMQVLDLGLANVSVHRGRAEQMDSGFDVAVSRAVRAPVEGLATLLPLVRIGGSAMVAGSKEIEGFEMFSGEIPEVDSPRRIFMMTRTEMEPQ